MERRNKMKHLMRTIILAGVAILILLGVQCYANRKIYICKAVPACSYGVLMCPDGTSKFYHDNFFKLRWATKRLAKEGKIAALIISGTNTSPDCAEVDSMVAAIKKDVPDLPIALIDYDGSNPFTTLRNAGDVMGHRSNYVCITAPRATHRAILAGTLLFGHDHICAVNINEIGKVY